MIRVVYLYPADDGNGAVCDISVPKDGRVQVVRDKQIIPLDPPNFCGGVVTFKLLPGDRLEAR